MDAVDRRVKLIIGEAVARAYGTPTLIDDDCTCDLQLLELDVRDVACPTHGLQAFLGELVTA